MIVTFCKDNGSGMSECTESGTGYENQSHCDFAKKSSDGNRCRFQVFDEYCNLEAAQRYAKGGQISPHELQHNKWLQEHEKLHRKFRKEFEHPTFNHYHDAMPYAEISDDGLSMTFPTLQDNSGTLSEEQLLELQKTVEEIKNCDHEVKEISCITEIDHNHKMVEKFHDCDKQQYAMTFTDHEEKWRDDAWSFKSETINYIYSRELTKSIIMERYNAGRMKVISAENMQRLVSTIKTKPRLFDTEHLVFYDQNGELVFDETLDFLFYKQPNWRVLVPAASIPKLVDFGFRRAARANWSVKWPIDTRFPKKDVCNDCAPGYKFCKHQCKKYSVL